MLRVNAARSLACNHRGVSLQILDEVHHELLNKSSGSVLPPFCFSSVALVVQLAAVAAALLLDGSSVVVTRRLL